MAKNKINAKSKKNIYFAISCLVLILSIYAYAQNNISRVPQSISVFQIQPTEKAYGDITLTGKLQIVELKDKTMYTLVLSDSRAIHLDIPQINLPHGTSITVSGYLYEPVDSSVLETLSPREIKVLN